MRSLSVYKRSFPNAFPPAKRKEDFPADEKGFLSVFAQEEKRHRKRKNLKYELSDYNLSPFVPLGVSNEFLEGKEGTIESRGGNLLVIKECHEYR